MKFIPTPPKAQGALGRRTAGEFRGFAADEGRVQLRQRVEPRGLAAPLPRLGGVTLGLIRQTEAIEVVGVLVARLFELRNRLVGLLLLQRHDASQFVRLTDEGGIA